MKRSFRRNLKAVSPVIATIIIVAIAIVMSIAVAYWLLGLGAAFTKYEKVEFTAAWVTTETANNFTLHMDLKNTGSAAATVDPTYILYNGRPAQAYTTSVPLPAFATFTMEPGNSTLNKIIYFPTTGNWVSGMTVEVMIHTTAGKDYPKVITLP